MVSDSIWLTSKHVIDGSADHVKRRQEKMCLCSACVENIDLVKTEEVCILDQSRLECIIEGIEQIDSLWHIGKYRDHHGKLATDRRTCSERRSSVDRRLSGAFLNTGQDRRIKSTDRRVINRRTEIRHA